MSDFLALWPGRASAYGTQIDMLLGSFTVLVVLLSAPVFVLMVVFAVRYRRGRPADRKHPVNQKVGLEISWALVPFVLILGFYVWATDLFFELHHPPADALEIDVVAKQWMWKFQHPGGQGEIDELHVPAGQPVRLTMTSQDAIHSLFIPALRIKQDVLPGRYTSLWFEADQPGAYRMVCAEFCGTDHSVMGGRFVVLSPSDYAAWLEQGDVDLSLAAKGEILFRTRGCSGCHGPAATVHAPPLEDLYGQPVPLADGTVVIADEQYIRDSILLPQKQIAAGYPRIMPTFENVLGEDEVLQLVAYIKSRGATRWSDRP
ncbi:cytochrome c oxidase subunit II [Geminicoccus roseus]|uniref:cytochrome c oxidase subunit II n=1 Tax=Geminicoccus roseus TaxID=404900 RepID=UPI000426A67B|nr:cytochrome c oxidase subunit II [Geminicoccus roseus]